MNLRDWLFLIGAVILIVIVLDGVRRMKQAKKDSLQMSRDMGGSIESSPLDDDYNPELPAGGARIVRRQEGDLAIEVDPHQDADSEILAVKESGIEIPVQTELGGMVADQDDRLHGDRYERPVPPLKEKGKPAVKKESSAGTPLKKEFIPNVTAEATGASKKKVNAPVVEAGTAKVTKLPSEVLVINVDARTPQGFSGSQLKHLLEACGLVHGDMSIFHRHEEDDLLSPLQFSVANGVEPGYFDPDNIETISTPRVAFFLSLPGPRDSMRAFDYMLETAQCFAKNLDGELRDEYRSVITQQTIEHCRQRVREFERKQLSRNRKV